MHLAYRCLAAAAAMMMLLGASEAKKTRATTTTLNQCLSNHSVPVILSASSSWTTYEATYNTRLQYTPAAIVLPTTAQHISDAVVCAGENGFPVQAKSGGHSYASFSTGGRNGAVMIDLENLQNVSVDANGIATVGAGLRLGNLATAIYEQAERALAHGTCPGVGIGGHFTHGGYGYSSRAWGLALDQIVALDVVLANGSYIHATVSEYPEVFYVGHELLSGSLPSTYSQVLIQAMRGAADSIGIAVNFYLQTQPAPSEVVNFNYNLNNMFSKVSTTVSAFEHIQNFAQNATVVDRNLGFGIYLDGQGFTIEGTYFGTLSDFQNRIAPELLRGLPKPDSSSTVQSLDWISSLTNLGGASTLTVPVHGYDAHDDFFAKSVSLPQPLSAAELTTYFQYIFSNGINPPTSWFAIINLYGGPDSQINTKNTSFAAYSDRSSLWVVQHYGYADIGATFTTADLNLVTGLNNALTSGLNNSYGAYLNYVDPSLTAVQAHQLYYGADLYAQLQLIKVEVDPTNVFQNPQSVSPAT